MSEEIKIEDFMKIDLRVAKIKEAIEVPEADKLIKLILDVGELGEKTVFAGIKSAYSLEELQDKFVVVVSNLKPRQMKFGLSEGFIKFFNAITLGRFISNEGLRIFLL